MEVGTRPVDGTRGPAWLAFDRQEIGGAFGDLGTSLPLLAGMIITAGFDPGSVFAAFGAMQILSGIAYGLPLAVQPLKAVAALVIAGRIEARRVCGAGLGIGLVMLLLVTTGLVGWLGKQIPKPVIRGLQLGLGIKLAGLAVGQFVGADGWAGYLLAAACFGLVLGLRHRRLLPPALAVLGLGLAYAGLRHGPVNWVVAGPRWPRAVAFSLTDVWQGMLLLGLPQIPLSLANSIYATQQTVRDLFPRRSVSPERLGLTYSVMNLLSPWLGGVPVCHGSGGVAGHHAFGARTGGALLVSGVVFATAGIGCGNTVRELIHLVPLPALGVLLLFEALNLARLAMREAYSREEGFVMLLTGFIAIGSAYGFAAAMVVGTVVAKITATRIRMVE